MFSPVHYLSPLEHFFPPIDEAAQDPDGLLAIGGDLSPSRLLLAYSQGIFPWFNEGEPILWWSPSLRGVLEFDDFRINRSFAKFLKKNPFSISVNKCFVQTINHCKNVNRYGHGEEHGTWITNDMVNAYCALHHLGKAHSIEVWQDGEQVGGLYGVVIGRVFCGESMFHLASNASRVAYAALVTWLQRHDAHFIDCQMQNDFLKTLGVTEISRELYLTKLKKAQQDELPQSMWLPQTIEL